MLRNSGHQPNSPYCRFRGGYYTPLVLSVRFRTVGLQTPTPATYGTFTTLA